MDIYEFLYKVYDYYNKELFNNALPYVVITLEDRDGYRGYYSSSKFIIDNKKNNVGQLCINPKYFTKDNEERVFSTIVHEMCHIYMKLCGEDVVKGYHSKKWANKMMEVGLFPTSNGKRDGKQIGFSMTHIIEKNGLFEKKTKILLKEEKFRFSILSNDSSKIATEKTSGKSYPGKRVRYHCKCSSFWGKKNMNVFCNKCKMNFIIDK